MRKTNVMPTPAAIIHPPRKTGRSSWNSPPGKGQWSLSSRIAPRIPPTMRIRCSNRLIRASGALQCLVTKASSGTTRAAPATQKPMVRA